MQPVKRTRQQPGTRQKSLVMGGLCRHPVHMGKPKKKDLPDLSHLAVRDGLIAVKVVPKAARNALTVADGLIKVAVTAAPENGKATEAVRQLLARAMGTASSNLELRRGATSRSKVFVYIGAEPR